MSHFWIDGNPVEPTPEQLKLFDPANPKTFGVFETLRTYNGKLFKMDEHLARLLNSATLLGFALPQPIEKIATFLERAVQESATELRVKCIATPSHIFIQASPLLIDPIIYEGVSAVSYAATRDQPEAKALPYNLSFEAHSFAEEQGAYEAILVDEEGLITEGAYSNIFWVKEGTVFTRQDKVLEGITRTVVMNLIPVKWGEITSNELLKADEVFLTKSTTGPVPITSIEGHFIGAGQPGPIYKDLIIKFKQLTQSHE